MPQVTVTIPEKHPYEGKASLKQKRLLWDYGFRDQAILDNLGKVQASAMITQIKATFQARVKRRNRIVFLIIVAVLIFVWKRMSSHP